VHGQKAEQAAPTEVVLLPCQYNIALLKIVSQNPFLVPPLSKDLFFSSYKS
jgi:hypothetical protein